MASLPVNGLDFVVILLILVSAMFAYFRGFAHEILTVAAWLGAVFATIYGLPYAKPYARQFLAIEFLADLVAGVVVFVVSLIAFSLITNLIGKWAQGSGLGMLNRSLGFLFGILRGALLICLVYVGVEWMMPPDDQPPWMRTARTMRLIETGSVFLRSLVPDETEAAGARAAEVTRERTRRFIEAQKALRDMMAPKPESPKSEDPAGYAPQERKEMERLIETTP